MTKKELFNDLNLGDVYLILYYTKNPTRSTKVNGLIQVSMKPLTRKSTTQLKFGNSIIDFPKQSEIKIIPNGFIFEFETQKIVYLKIEDKNSWIEMDKYQEYYCDIYTAFINENDRWIDERRNMEINSDTENNKVEIKYYSILTESKQKLKNIYILMEQNGIIDRTEFNQKVSQDFDNLSKSFDFGELQNWSSTFKDYDINGNKRVYFIPVIHDSRFVDPNEPLFEVIVYIYQINNENKITRTKRKISDNSLFGLSEQMSRYDEVDILEANSVDQVSSVLGDKPYTDKQWQ